MLNGIVYTQNNTIFSNKSSIVVLNLSSPALDHNNYIRTQYIRDYYISSSSSSSSSSNSQSAITVDAFTMVVDDFNINTMNDVLQYEGVPVGGLANCTSMIFEFTVIRKKNDIDPQSIVIQFYYSVTYIDPDTGINIDIADSNPFFSKTLLQPDNGWEQDSFLYTQPHKIRITLENGTLDDNNNPFDLFYSNNYIEKPHLWVGIYTNLPFHFDTTTLQYNAFYWLFSNPDYTGTTSNYYEFCDFNDTLQMGWVQWTNGTDVSTYLGFSMNYTDMAWSVLVEYVDDTPMSIQTSAPPTLSTLVPTILSPFAPPTNGSYILDPNQPIRVMGIVIGVIAGTIFVFIISYLIFRCCVRCYLKGNSRCCKCFRMCFKFMKDFSFSGKRHSVSKDFHSIDELHISDAHNIDENLLQQQQQQQQHIEEKPFNSITNNNIDIENV